MGVLVISEHRKGGCHGIHNLSDPKCPDCGYDGRMMTPNEWISKFELQPLRRIPLTREQISMIQYNAQLNHTSYPCKHGVTNYCGLCENGL